MTKNKIFATAKTALAEGYFVQQDSVQWFDNGVYVMGDMLALLYYAAGGRVWAGPSWAKQFLDQWFTPVELANANLQFLVGHEVLPIEKVNFLEDHNVNNEVTG
jgi:hypothetical protein